LLQLNANDSLNDLDQLDEAEDIDKKADTAGNAGQLVSNLFSGSMSSRLKSDTLMSAKRQVWIV
jgi:hypothetical protein